MDPQLQPEQLDNVRHVLRAGGHLLGLINEVLDITRIESREMTLSVEPVPVRDVMEEVVDLTTPLSTARAIRVTLDCPGSTRWIAADRQRFKQGLLNLVSNGVKYNRDGGEVCVRCADGDGGRIRLSVSDTGPGIPPEKLGRLFRPFDRLGAEQSGIEGTGLGLSLTKGLVELMSGSVGVESVPGEGSTFWIELPPAESPLQAVTDARRDRWDAEVLASRPWVILYVEDNLSNLTVIERLLTRWPNVKLLSAMQGRLGLELAAQHRPDVILLDLHLPDMPGHDVLAELRSNPEVAGIPVVVVSADATPRQVERLMAAGADDYITKPLDLRAFIATLERMLGAHPLPGPTH
jgi:CheY-like chemotaxis protein